MVEERASGRSAKIFIEGRNSINREILLKYMRSNFERLSLRNIESFQEIILLIQKEISGLVKEKSYIENEVKV